MIDPSIWDDEDVGCLSDGAFRLFIACISNADDYGKLEGSPTRLRAIAFRFRAVSLGRVTSYLDELTTRLRSVQRYAVNGRECIRLVNWDRYQFIRADRRIESCVPDPAVTWLPNDNQAAVTWLPNDGIDQVSIDKNSIGEISRAPAREPAVASDLSLVVKTHQALQCLMPGTDAQQHHELLGEFIGDYGAEEVLEVLQDMRCRGIKQHGVMPYLRKTLRDRAKERLAAEASTHEPTTEPRRIRAKTEPVKLDPELRTRNLEAAKQAKADMAKLQTEIGNRGADPQDSNEPTDREEE
jgi:hypothetical protein